MPVNLVLIIDPSRAAQFFLIAYLKAVVVVHVQPPFRVQDAPRFPPN
jgi:hypothetical protein